MSEQLVEQVTVRPCSHCCKLMTRRNGITNSIIAILVNTCWSLQASGSGKKLLTDSGATHSKDITGAITDSGATHSKDIKTANQRACIGSSNVELWDDNSDTPESSTSSFGKMSEEAFFIDEMLCEWILVSVNHDWQREQIVGLRNEVGEFQVIQFRLQKSQHAVTYGLLCDFLAK